MADLTLKSGEAKWITFRVVDEESGAPIDVSGATFQFAMRMRTSTTATVTKDDAAFDKTDAAQGVVRVYLSSADTAPGSYVGELKTNFGGETPHIDKTVDYQIEVLRSTTS